MLERLQKLRYTCDDGRKKEKQLLQSFLCYYANGQNHRPFSAKKERKPNESKWGCRMESKRITNYDREMGK